MSNNMAMAVSNPKDMLAVLEKSRSAIQMALPKHLNPDRMMRLALTSFSTNPALRQCTAQSIIASVVVASQLGLEPGVAGQGYLIPYKDTCTFVPGWQGLVGLLNNTGRATAWTGSVFEGDTWDFQLGSSPSCNHIPGENYGDPDKLIWVYACGKVNGSEQPVIEAWPIKRVIKHRDKFNKVGQRHYSYTNFEMYARKVVLLQVLKYMPRSIELNNAIVAADAAEIGKTTRVEDGVIIEADPTDIDSPNFNPPPAAPSLLNKPKEKQKVNTPPPPAQEPKPATAPTESKKDEGIRIMSEAGVPFDDFRDFVSLKRIVRDDVSAWGGYDEVPAEVFEKMSPVQMAECLRTYRTQGNGQS
jgi:recombination protein RecT